MDPDLGTFIYPPPYGSHFLYDDAITHRLLQTMLIFQNDLPIQGLVSENLVCVRILNTKMHYHGPFQFHFEVSQLPK